MADGVGVEFVTFAKVGLAAHDGGETVAQSHAVKAAGSGAVFQKDFRYETAEAAFDGVFFEGDDDGCFSGGGEDWGGVERAQGVDAEDAGFDFFFGESVGGFEGFFDDAAGRNDGEVVALAAHARAADDEFFAGGFVAAGGGFVEAEVTGSGSFNGGFGRFHRFPQIAWRKNRDAGNGAKDRDVFGGVVGHAEGAVREAAADGNDFHVGVVVGGVVSNLFEATQSGKIADRVSENDQTFKGHPRGEAGHVLFGDTDVEKLLGKFRREIGEDAEAEIGREQHEARIVRGELREALDKMIAHYLASNSLRAWSKSAPLAVR